MTYGEALSELKRGKAVTRAGKVYRLGSRGLYVSNGVGEPERTVFDKDDRKASDWDVAAEE